MVDYEIHSVPLSVPCWRHKVERFLEANQLRLDEVDYYAIVTEPGDDEILSGGGLLGDVIKCVAVCGHLRDAHLCNLLVSHLISEAAQRGHQQVKVFTKPQNRGVFESLGFRLVGEAPLAILMENGHGISRYCQYLRSPLGPKERSFERSESGEGAPPVPCAAEVPQRHLESPEKPDNQASPIGVIVMNANPFTLGHRYLIEQAARQVSHLFIIPVKEERSLFTYDERKAMIKAACSDLSNVVVLEGSDYQISAATFPTYFLKQLSEASDTQMLLDIDIFRRHIAPALQRREERGERRENSPLIRFVGTEPNDALTGRYNELLQEHLPGVQVIERIQRSGRGISASAVRQALHDCRFADAVALVPSTTLPYLLAHLACDALRQELDTTPKPGLVDKADSGAHTDMDYRLMLRSIESLRPYFVKLAQAGLQGKTDHATISAIGLEAERAMLAATGGVNTHKGALFALGLALAAATHLLRAGLPTDANLLCQTIAELAQQFPEAANTHGSLAVSQHQAKGALSMARDGYRQLFSDWLPFYLEEREKRREECNIRTLLHIMTQLDDTNIYYRKGSATAQRVKADAADLLNSFSTERVEALNRRYIQENISPGGAADMLALTILMDKITESN